MKRIDVLSVGEILIDLISETEQASLACADSFRRYSGGEAANVAWNVARLGGRSALVARVGDDSFGELLRKNLHQAGVDVTHVLPTLHMPTTLVVVSRHHVTPDFTVYRGADAQLLPEDMPVALLPQVALVHTSAFALSREPARSTILEFVRQAHGAGCLISFDPNYHPRLWGADEEAFHVFEGLGPYVFLLKPSFDDAVRLFGRGKSPEAYTDCFLEWGVRHVVLTMGADGVWLANAEGKTFFATKRIDVADVTGAGDSFWSGLLLAVLDEYTIEDAIRVGQAVAEIKLRQVGPLMQEIDRKALYKQLGLWAESTK